MRGRTVALVASITLPLFSQHGSTSAVNPYTGPENVLSGAKLYRAQCAGCHGADGGGTATGPNLTSGTFQRGGSDEALFRSIAKGVPGTAMPAFNLSALRIWELVTYIRSLAVERGGAASAGSQQAGAALFRTQCSGCHTIGGEGGFRGPDLTGIGSRRSAAELHTAIGDPDAAVPSEYWSLTIKTGGGETIRGIRLNEDTHSVQLRDDRSRLVSVLKSDIASSDLSRKSPMPKFAGKLTDVQIDDLIAWLRSQKEAR